MASKFAPPQLAPDLLARQLRMQQQAQDAERLIEQGSQMPQGQMVSGHYVAPSWTQQLASALSGPVGRSIQDKLPDEMAGIQRDQRNAMLSQFGFIPSPQQLADGLNGGAQSMPVDMGGQQAQAGQQPMLLPGMNEQQSMMALDNLGPAEYLKIYQDQFKPTNEQRNLAHLPEPQRNALIAAPFMNEAGKDGVRMIMGNDGQMYAVPVQGYAESQAAITGATERARAGAQAQYDLVAVPDGQGGTRMMPRSQAVGELSGGMQPQWQGEAGSPSGEGRFGDAPSQKTLEARERLVGLTQQGEALLSTINALESVEGLDEMVGIRTYIPAIRGTARYDFEKQLEQAQSQVFLEGYERLKGGGVITDFEGSKAEKAIARIDSGQSPEAFRSGLNDLRDVVMAGIRRAYSNAGMDVPAQYAQPEADARARQLDQLLGF